MSGSDPTTSYLPAVPEVTADDRRRMALHVAGNARDAQDCRMLLEALGLLDPTLRREDREAA